MFQRTRFGKANDFGQLSRCEAGKRATRREQFLAGLPIAQHNKPPAELDPPRQAHRICVASAASSRHSWPFAAEMMSTSTAS